MDSVVHQGQAHDSLLKSGSESFWTYVDSVRPSHGAELGFSVAMCGTVVVLVALVLNNELGAQSQLGAYFQHSNCLQVATDSSPEALRSIASAVSAIPDVPFAVKSSLASLAASVQGAVTSAGLVPELAPVRTALQASWAAMRKSDLLPTLPAGGLSLPDLPDIPSLQDIQASALADITTSSLFNGTYTEGQIAAIVSAIIAISVISAATARATQPATVASDAELPTEYDEGAIQRYWSTRPVMMFKRSIETAWLASGFLVGLRLDKLFGEEKKNEKMRARALRLAVDRLGPAYIKIAQALSTRVDLLSPAYYEEIILLQDRVAPFPTPSAMRIMEVRYVSMPSHSACYLPSHHLHTSHSCFLTQMCHEPFATVQNVQEELGGPVSNTFSEVTPAPVASASLGQVYRAKLVGSGEEVAIKVQRPGVLELVALDLVLGRRGLLIANQLFPNVRRFFKPCVLESIDQ